MTLNPDSLAPLLAEIPDTITFRIGTPDKTAFGNTPEEQNTNLDDFRNAGWQVDEYDKGIVITRPTNKPNKDEIKRAAYKLCRIRHLDPDELVTLPMDAEGHAVIRRGPRWTEAAKEIRAHMEIQTALRP